MTIKSLLMGVWKLFQIVNRGAVYMVEQDLKKVLGKNIKFFRFRRQFSQTDLAEKAGISVTFLSNIERGNNFPQAGTLCSLSRALHIEVWELFRGEGAVNQKENIFVDNLAEDLIKHINITMETVCKQYRH